MTARGSRASGRWKATLPNDEIKPVGPNDCLRRAVEKLGPLRHKLQEDAELRGPWQGLNGRLALSEELAYQQVWSLATNYNRQQRLDRNAPRPRDVMNQLSKLETLAGELARFLPLLDDLTRHRLQTAGTGINSFCTDFHSPLFDEADIIGLPVPTRENDPETPSRWVRRLEALSEYANFAQRMFLRSKDIDSPELLDRGGNTNLYKALYGSAQWALVNGGWQIYELFKPGKATGTEGGAFHLFLLDVFEYATGLEPEENSKLTYWLKRVSSSNRRYVEILRRQEILRDELDAIENYESDQNSENKPERCASEEKSKRSDEISKELIELERDRLEVWPSLFPYSYPQSRAR
jgi:hypothetical protein